MGLVKSCWLKRLNQKGLIPNRLLLVFEGFKRFVFEGLVGRFKAKKKQSLFPRYPSCGPLL